MSKILEAMRKASFDGANLSERLSLLDGVNLYPVDTDQQTAEFEQLSSKVFPNLEHLL